MSSDKKGADDKAPKLSIVAMLNLNTGDKSLEGCKKDLGDKF